MQIIIQTPCANFNKAKEFYKKLKFKELNSDSEKVIFSDGKSLIEINSKRTTRLALQFFKENWDLEIQKLKELVTITKFDDYYLFALPCGTWIKLIQKTEINFKQEKPYSVLGNNMGLSLETTDIKKSIAILNVLDFSKTMGEIEQGWLVMTHKNGTAISLMTPNVCPHLFYNPSLTFFNGKDKNPIIIQEIKKLNIPITEEITHFNKDNKVDNILLRDNGGLGFFVFND